MNIYTIRDNLRNTIAGKEALLVDYQEARKHLAGAEDAALFASVSFLKVNIDELKRLLADVEKCCEIETSRSWEGSVDRMSGAFDESELRGRDGWL